MALNSTYKLFKYIPGVRQEWEEGSGELTEAIKSGSELQIMECTLRHRAARTLRIPVNVFPPERHLCFDDVTNASVTQPLPS